MTGPPKPGRHRPCPGAPGRRGFSLLEVMVALAVLAMALTAVSDVVGGALQNHVRARQLEVATMLARGRLAEAEAKYEEEGFRDFDQSETGTFDEEGHPEVSWKLETLKPQIELGPDAVLKALTGIEGGVAGLLGLDAKGQGSAQGQGTGGAAGGPITSLAGSPLAGTAVAMIQQQLTGLGEKLKSGVRQVRLTVGWKDGKATESFTLVTHLVVLSTGAQKRQAAAVPSALQPNAPVPPGTPPRPFGGGPRP
jgi:general secretion pathway protein I